jgi:hypothetical protein
MPDDIRQNGDWIIQRKPAPDNLNGAEYTTYKFIGAAENGLLLVLASYSGGGTGDFVTLHLLSLDAVPAFDSNGEIYDRINLTNLRSIALGDRWDGEVSIAKNTVRIGRRARARRIEAGRGKNCRSRQGSPEPR